MKTEDEGNIFTNSTGSCSD